MPHLQYELDALKKVPMAARACGLPEAAIGYGLPIMWAHCWQSKDDIVSTIQLCGFFGGDAGVRVGLALEAFGFLERMGEDEWRARGANRYLRITASRSAGGKAAQAKLRLLREAASSAGAGLELDREEALTPIIRSSDHSNTETATPPAEDLRQEPKLEPGKKARPERAKSAAQKAVDFFLEERAEKTDLSDAPMRVEKINAKIGPIVEELGRPGWNAAVRAYLADTGYPAKQSTPWPLALFADQWRRYRQAGGASEKPTQTAFEVVPEERDPYREG